MSNPNIPVIDSHIHLYPESELPTLAWCKPDSPLAKQCSIEQYRAATGSPPNLRGFIFVESDRKNDDGRAWELPLMEAAWAARIASGQPKPGEGHTAEDARLCLGIVLWAPMSSGPEMLAKYLDAVRSQVGKEVCDKIKGFRYLVQDKPARTMLEDGFIGSLKLLGEKGLVFELGVDQHRRGRSQLEEAVEMIDRAHDGVDEDDKVVFIVNHLCKPDLTIINPTDPSFIAWRTAMFTLSKCSKVYVKLSGLLSEMPESLRTRSPQDIFMAAFPWLAVVLAAFGPSRTMFGSDWPVCTAGVDDGAWERWRAVVARMCYMATLSEEDEARVFSGTAAEAYGIDLE